MMIPALPKVGPRETERANLGLEDVIPSEGVTNYNVSACVFDGRLRKKVVFVMR